MEAVFEFVLYVLGDVIFALLVAPFHPRSTFRERLAGSAAWLVLGTVVVWALAL